VAESRAKYELYIVECSEDSENKDVAP